MIDKPTPTTPSDRLRGLFERVADLSAAERETVLRENRVSASERAALLALLDADRSEDGVFGTAAVDWAERLEGDVEAVSLAGQRIGAYTLIELLGEGGSAVVYRATRPVADAEQTVALKLLRTGLFSAEARRRFRREQAILTQLSHPNIARLVDAGVSDTGVPYIAMELVDGLPLTTFADRRGLDEDARLRLLVEVCRAVDAAHRALVVHRDLKPSNVLVTHAGEVKVLDFGIAKLLDDDDAPTATQHIALTPGYAAPEQYRVGTVTTAADVYSLGVLASELLVGARLGADATWPDSDGAARLETRRRWRALDTDLCELVRTTLATDPQQRYSSAGHLADDIVRYLRDEPITAHPPSSWYRARKFVARHRGGVAVTALFVLAIFASLGLALWQANVARHEAQRANSVRDFLERLFEPIRGGVAQDKQPTLNEIFAAGVDRLDGNKAMGDAERVDLLLMFARLYDYRSESARMQALADRASALAQTTFGANDPRTLDALVASAIATLRRGDNAAAKPKLEEAAKRFEAAHVGGVARIRLYDALAALNSDAGDPAHALEYERVAYDERVKEFGADSEETIGGDANLAFGYGGVGRFDDAAASYRRVYQFRLAREGADAASTASALGGLATAEGMAGHLRAARDDFRKVAATFAALGGTPRATYVALAQHQCAVESTVAPSESKAPCANAARIAAQADGDDSATLGRAERVVAAAAIERGELADARAALEHSMKLLTNAGQPPWIGRTEIALGELDFVEGKTDAAARELSQGVEHLGAGFPPYLRRYGLALRALACDAQTNAACPADATAQALAALAGDSYQWNALLLPAHIAVARVDRAHGRNDAAAARLRTAIERAKGEVDATQPRLVEAQLWLAALDADANRCDEARALAQAGRAAKLDAHPLLAKARAELRASSRCGLLE